MDNSCVKSKPDFVVDVECDGMLADLSLSQATTSGYTSPKDVSSTLEALRYLARFLFLFLVAKIFYCSFFLIEHWLAKSVFHHARLIFFPPSLGKVFRCSLMANRFNSF